MSRIVIIFLIVFSNIFTLEIKDNKVYDDYGNSIELKEYKRIVVYNYGVVEMFFKLDRGDKIVAVGDHRKEIWPKEKTEKIPKGGPISKPSVERILTFNPDLVIFNVMGNRVKELERVGVPSIIYSNKSLEDIINNFEIISLLVGNKKDGEIEGKKLREKLKEIKSKERLTGKALILYSTLPLSSFSKESLPVEILEGFGLNVITPSYGKKSIISSEYILEENPNIIIGTRGVGSVEEIEKSLPLLEELDAYKNKRIYQIDSTVILRGSHRVFQEIDNIYEKIKK